SLTQTQTGEGVTEAFRLPLRLDFKLEGEDYHSSRIEMTEREQAFYITLPSKPKFVRLDGEILKTVDFDQAADMLREQVAHDDNALGRIEAARALGKKADKDAIAALGKVVREDGFWGVQAEAAKALG